MYLLPCLSKLAFALGPAPVALVDIPSLMFLRNIWLPRRIFYLLGNEARRTAARLRVFHTY